MTTQTNNDNTSFLATSLAAWSDGNGNPINPPNSNHKPIFEVITVDTEASTINGTVVSHDTLFSAVAVQLWRDSGYGQDALRLNADITRLGKGYVSSAHETKANASKPAVRASDTFVTTKRVLTANEYLDNAVQLAFNPSTVADLLLGTYSITDKTTKADLLVIVHRMQELLLPRAAYEVFEVKASDEAAAKVKFARLEEAGYTDIQTVSDGRYCAKLELSKLGGIAALLPDFTIVGSVIPLPSGTAYQVSFKDAIITE